MKATMLAPLMLLTLSASAATLICPEGARPILTCTSSTQPYDDIEAIDFMQGALIRQNAKGLTMYLDVRGANEVRVSPIREISRPGATAYLGKTNESEFSLNRLVVRGEVNSTFHIDINGIRVARSLSCR